MSAAQHTPGPWAVFNGTDIFPDNDLGGDRHIADCFPVQDGIPYAEREANARLIAAAPDLLKALTNCLSFLRAKGHGDTLVAEAAEAIIAKATTP